MKRNAGLTLMELVVVVSILGLLAFLMPLLTRLFNSLAYLEQKSLIQKEAKALLWQISHDVTNAVHVDIANPSNSALPPPDCPGSALGECMTIWVYDFDRYEGATGSFENPDMYKFMGNNWSLTYGRIVYKVVPATPGHKAYILRESFWPPGSPTINKEGPTTFLLGRVVGRDTSLTLPPTFSSYGGQQFFKVTLRLRSTYDRSTESPRFFSAAVTMASQKVW